MLAIFAPRSRQTTAFVPVSPIQTNASVLAGICQAFIDGPVAQIASVTRVAIARVAVNAVPVNASAVIVGFFAFFAPEPYGTVAPVAADLIDAHASIIAGIRAAFVDVCLAMLSSVS